MITKFKIIWIHEFCLRECWWRLSSLNIAYTLYTMCTYIIQCTIHKKNLIVVLRLSFSSQRQPPTKIILFSITNNLYLLQHHHHRYTQTFLGRDIFHSLRAFVYGPIKPLPPLSKFRTPPLLVRIQDPSPPSFSHSFSTYIAPNSTIYCVLLKCEFKWS